MARLTLTDTVTPSHPTMSELYKKYGRESNSIISLLLIFKKKYTSHNHKGKITSPHPLGLGAQITQLKQAHGLSVLQLLKWHNAF